MSAQFMRRSIRISVRLTEEEHRLLKKKMARIGVTNQEAFLRKMALDGLVIKLDLPELKQMISPALHEQQHQPDRQTAQRERQSLRNL